MSDFAWTVIGGGPAGIAAVGRRTGVDIEVGKVKSPPLTPRCLHQTRTVDDRSAHAESLRSNGPTCTAGFVDNIRFPRKSTLFSSSCCASPYLEICAQLRNLLAWAKKARLNRSVHISHQQAPPSRSLTQEQRLAWLRETPYRRFRNTGLPRCGNPSALVRSAPDRDRGSTDIGDRNYGQ